MSRAKDTPDIESVQIRDRLFWLIALVAWGLVFAALVSFDPADAPGHAVAPTNASPANWIGPAGALLAHELYFALGIGVWFPVVASAVMLIMAAFNGPVSQFAFRLVGITIMGLVASSYHAIFFPTLTTFPEGAGGLLAIAGTDALVGHFGVLGASMWLILALAIGATVAFDRWLLVAPGLLIQSAERLVRRPGAFALNAAVARSADRMMGQLLDVTA